MNLRLSYCVEYYIIFFRGHPWSISGYIEDDPNRRSIAYLDQYSTERWDTVLHYMVSDS